MVRCDAQQGQIMASFNQFRGRLIAPQTAAEEHAAELAQGPEAATLYPDPLAEVIGESHGTDADAGDYLTDGGEEA